MGTWGVGLYQCDDASDLREDFREVVRAPWDGDRLLAWALDAYPDTDSQTDMRLALADLFWTYGIEHRAVLEAALALIDDGGDLESKRELGMSDRDLKKRAAVLNGLSAKWRRANPKPRNRRMLKEAQPFVLGVGDCLTYPTAGGRVRNPYVPPAREEKFYKAFPWEQDGHAAAIVLACVHRFETFARYLVAILRYDSDQAPTLDLSRPSRSSTAGRLRSSHRVECTSSAPHGCISSGWASPSSGTCRWTGSSSRRRSAASSR